MEGGEDNIDISDPQNFVWGGPTACEFDKESYLRMTNITTTLHDSLSRKKRKEISKNRLLAKKSYLEFLANQHLLRLDIYSAALKVDSRTLSTKNAGIATSIDDATSKKTINRARYQINIEKKAKEYELIEKKKKAEFQNSLNELNEVSSSCKKKINELEKESEKLSKYQEWIKLNKNLYDLTKRRENLENAIEKQKYLSYNIQAKNPAINEFNYLRRNPF